jgi:hypothetical protein
MFWIVYSYVVAVTIGILGFIIWSLKQDLHAADEYIDELEEKCDTLDKFRQIVMN